MRLSTDDLVQALTLLLSLLLISSWFLPFDQRPAINTEVTCWFVSYPQFFEVSTGLGFLGLLGTDGFPTAATASICRMRFISLAVGKSGLVLEGLRVSFEMPTPQFSLL